MSGEGYISHPIAVARIVAEIGLDDVSLVAALLHDAVETLKLRSLTLSRHLAQKLQGS